MTGRDVIFSFSFVTWDGAVERGMSFPEDRLLAHLSAAPEVSRLLIANPYRSSARRLARSALGRDRPLPGGSGVALFSPAALRFSDPVAPQRLRERYRRYGRQLAEAAGRAGLERPAVVTSHPFVAAYAGLEWAGPVTYYATDDWAAHPAYEALRPMLRKATTELRRHAICAVSAGLRDRIDPVGPSLVVPNGVDPAEWSAPAGVPARLEGLPRPWLVYAGTLDDRLDVDMLAGAARRGTVILVGPGRPPLAGHPRVHMTGPLSRENLVAVIAAADAGIIPHRRTALTEVMSPLKLYEYLAAGKPVAATDLPPIRDVGSPRVMLAGNDFAAAVDDALALGPEPESERRAFISANAWARRHAALLRFALQPAAATVAG